jgi:hypothetical protein
VDVEVIPHDLVIRVYDEAGNVIKTHEQASDFREFWQPLFSAHVSASAPARESTVFLPSQTRLARLDSLVAASFRLLAHLWQ